MRWLGVLVIASLGILALRSVAQEREKEAGLQGTWEGTLGSGAAKLRLIVTLTKITEGSYAGKLNSVDQGATLQIENATLKGDAVRFEVGKIGGVYQGYFVRAGKEIRGTWTQTGVAAQPLVLTRREKGEAAAAAAAPAEHTPKPRTPPLDVVVPIAPTAFKAGGKWNLVYELHAANLGKWDATVARIDVLTDDAAPKLLASFSGPVLDGMVEHPGIETAEITKIGAGGFAVVYMWVTLERQEEIPATIRHRLILKIGDFPEGITLEGVPIEVDKSPVAVISAPLAGDNWLAGNGPSNTSIHRRALIPINGRAVIAQRFAIDWAQLYPDGKSYQGDPGDNRNYRAYGAEIRAVADGIVTQVKDGIQQNAPGATSRAVPMTLETLAGNYVIVEIGRGEYALYAHMQPGSLRAQVGDKVREGQVLGLVGNSGNSSEPHLHFDICNANSALGCEGLPYAFASFEVEGHGWGWKSSDAHDAPVKHEMEIPLEGDVVKFPPH
jgi:murein DD-endopeptidase